MRGGFAAFGGMVVITTVIVAYIHDGQRRERNRMREGVYRDIERMNQKAAEKD
jgi:hypothetical protein